MSLLRRFRDYWTDNAPDAEETRAPKRRRVDSGPKAVVDEREGSSVIGTESDKDDGALLLPSLPQKHEALWFEDGNIVLIAEDTAFRVYRRILSSHSPVFRERLASLKHKSESDLRSQMEGCPVLHVDDRADDFALFLKIIFDGASVWLGSRLSKYQVAALLDGGMDRFRSRLPSLIHLWDRRMHCFDANLPSDSISMANVARQLNEPDLYLRALYECCHIPNDVLIRGDSHGTLCVDDLIAVLNTKQHGKGPWMSIHNFPLCDSQSAPCKLATQEGRYRLPYGYVRDLDDTWTVQTGLDPDVCAACVQHYAVAHSDLRQQALDDLSKYVLAMLP